MCDICEQQFDIMTEHFDEAFTRYQEATKAGLVRGTPAQRVHDLAFEHQDACEHPTGRTVVSWYLAITLERLAALEASGVPT